MNALIRSTVNWLHWRSLPAVTGPCVAVVKTDAQSPNRRGQGKLPYLVRGFDNNKKLRAVPQSVPLFGDRGDVDLGVQWQVYSEQINTKQATKYLRRPFSGWVNKKPWPNVKQVTWGGAYVAVEEVANGWAYLYSYDNDRLPEEYQTDFNQLLTVCYNNDTYGEPDQGPIYTFLIANAGKRLRIKASELYYLRDL